MEEQLNNAPCGYVSITDKGIITYVNQTFLRMIDRTHEELIHQHIESFMTMANKMLFHTYFYPFIQLHGHIDEMYLTLKSSKKQDVPVLLNGRRYKRDGIEMIDCVFVKMSKRMNYEQEIRSAKKKTEEAYQVKNELVMRLEKLHEELEEKQKALLTLNEELAKQATTDSLTGLKNRRVFLEKLEESMTLFSQLQEPFAVLMLDIDYFKKLNDTWGHLIGDRVLVKVAKIMESISRDIDVIARYGGEEFIILLPNTNEEEAHQTAEKIRHTIEQASWNSYGVTISIGATLFELNDTVKSITARADRALYLSKNHGRNRVTFLSPSDEMVQKSK